MTCTTSRFSSRLIQAFIPPLACVLLFAHAALGVSNAPASKPAACNASELTFDDTSDIQSVIYYRKAIQQLLTERKFVELDCIADAARANKSRFPAGGWKLNVLYLALREPEGHATEEDWTTRLKTLQAWVSSRPKSITARVALADAYTVYAWNARGSDYSDTVTQSGWKLFGQRIDKAKEILEKASRLEAKCPHWYAVMQTVALAEGWDLTRTTQLLEQAIGFEPDYQYYYRNHANYLKPQWNGEEGDAERFAQQAADHVGGLRGDILYYQIAVELICHCSAEPNLKLLSWPRIQKGVAELEKQNGQSLMNLNLLGYMAIKENDSVVAHAAFLRIGDNWDKSTWRTRQYFDYCKGWAGQAATYVESPGHQIVEQAKTKFATAVQQCAQEADGDVTRFDLVLRVQKDGVIDEVLSFPQTKVGLCLVKLKGETLSPNPPYAPYTFRIPIDPAKLSASAQ